MFYFSSFARTQMLRDKNLQKHCRDRRPRLSENGKYGVSLTGRVYKHFSTVYPAPTAEQLASGTYVPERLIGLALTNQPNNRENTVNFLLMK